MSRRGYAIALAAAVVVLISSMMVTALVMVGNRGDRGVARGPGIYGGNDRGPGMMGRGDDAQGGRSLVESQKIASDWLSANEPGAQLGRGVPMRKGDVFPVLRDGVTVGTLLVVDRNGAVRYRELRAAAPGPRPSGTA